MPKNLPPIFKVGNTNMPKDNNKKYSYIEKSKENMIVSPKEEDNIPIERKIDNIFNTKRYAFNIPVTITFAGKTITTYLATRTKNTIITLENESIPISTITDFKIENPID